MRFICSNMAETSLLGMRSLISVGLSESAHQRCENDTGTRQDPTELELGGEKQIYHRNIVSRSLAEGSI